MTGLDLRDPSRTAVFVTIISSAAGDLVTNANRRAHPRRAPFAPELAGQHRKSVAQAAATSVGGSEQQGARSLARHHAHDALTG